MLETEVTSHEFRKKSYDNMFILLGIGVGLTVTNYIQVWRTTTVENLQYMCFTSVCGKIIAQIRHQYVKAILRQNAGWFDKHHTGTLTTALNE